MATSDVPRAVDVEPSIPETPRLPKHFIPCLVPNNWAYRMLVPLDRCRIYLSGIIGMNMEKCFQIAPRYGVGEFVVPRYSLSGKVVPFL